MVTNANRLLVLIAAALSLAVSLYACERGSRTLSSTEPPPGWAAELAAEREKKDREFRESADTPLRSEDVASFRGLAYWPPDPRWRFTGSVEPNDRLERFTVVTTTGKSRPCERYGRVRFEQGGSTYTLSVFRLLDVPARAGAEDLFLPFLDQTSGKETYPAGRYVDLIGPKGGPYVLDLNRAYNPLCAYGDSERFACPATPPENRLPLRVEAGELGYRKEAGRS